MLLGQEKATRINALNRFPVQYSTELGYAFAEANPLEPEFETQFVTAGSLLYSVEHRPWLPPDAHWLFSQSWNDLLFAHFAIDPPTLRRLVPEALTLDLYDGVAWLTISSCSASHVRPSGVPPLPGISFFPQVNLRTYVTLQAGQEKPGHDKTGQEKPGLYYFSVDAANLSAVWLARIFFRMPYWHAAIQLSGSTIHAPNAEAHNPEERSIHFRSSRLHGPAATNGPAKFDVSYTPEGEPERTRRGTLDEFLTERYCVYLWNRGRCYRAEIHHQPWALQRTSVNLRANSMAEPLGLTLPLKPELCHFSRSLKMLAWAPERVRLSR